MVGRVMGLMMLGCVLGTTGCRKAERKPAPETTETVATRTETTAPAAPAKAVEPKPEAAPVQAAPQEPGDAIALQESATTGEREAPARPGTRGLMDDEDRIWLSESAEAARAANANIAPDTATEDITIASGTVDGRVKRVGARTIEVSDGEGNVYELRIDRRSRGLHQGRRVPLREISEGTPVRASFDLVGGGDSLARDIVLRR
ncbi:hypothetical protein CYFUS_001073 [Cystobacter fuscus]|uniref:Lipoprotein n=1 Tax=Cystobacter fuscus TaxID=43 RepID=A0A250IV78_9BACT|nr:hypothetical protein [Cystobacter fuscus]ATB35659.1 hypothetical protein CYFUS_001073 [Cystobacter fuscus]